MAILLVSDIGDEYMIPSTAWGCVLGLAERYGWHAMGTSLLPARGGGTAPAWDGGYCSNDGQRVNAEDALALGYALENALNDANPSDEPKDHKLTQAMAEAGFVSARVEFVSFLQNNRAAIEELAAFCRQGPFVIW
jgi:hypothetical protein